MGRTIPDPAEHHRIPVFYGTDRDRLEGASPDSFYGENRGELQFGEGVVGIDSAQGESYLEQVNPVSRDQFLQALRTAVSAAEQSSVVIFVHGYRRSFSRSLRLIAELVDETDFGGVPVAWSWPSTSDPTRYTVDETNIRWAQPDFSRFLRTIIDQSGAGRVHLVGHSLGARGLVEAIIQDLIPQGADLDKIGELVLLAPDIDQEIFRRDMAPKLLAAGLPVTLYASSNDKALSLAYRLHGSRRAGDTSDGALLVPGVETIDVSAANTSALGHSYFARSDLVARDLAQLLIEGRRASQREGLAAEIYQGQVYWRLVADR